MNTITLEKSLKESFGIIESDVIDKGLKELRNKLEHQYNSSLSIPSNYQLALQKYNEIKSLLDNSFVYKKEELRYVGNALSKAATQILGFRIEEEGLSNLQPEVIKFGNLLLCNSWLYIGFWRLLEETKNRNTASKLNGFRESVELITRSVEDFSEYISPRQWEEIYQAGIFIEQNLKTVKKAKSTFNLKRKLIPMVGFILWESHKNITASIYATVFESKEATSSKTDLPSSQFLVEILSEATQETEKFAEVGFDITDPSVITPLEWIADKYPEIAEQCNVKLLELARKQVKDLRNKAKNEVYSEDWW